MQKIKFIGVENTNGNRYNVTISPEEFMERVNLDVVINEKIRFIYDDFLQRALLPDFKLEHVDTHPFPGEDFWRVQLRLVLTSADIYDHFSERWEEIVMLMRYADPMWEKYFTVRARFDDFDKYAFYGVITFTVPAKFKPEDYE